jgi:hypothetical protein
MEETIKIQRAETEENRKQRYCDYERALKQLRKMKQQENRAEPQEKQIRFIDSHYNLKFYIPDGGKIRITFRDGHTADRVCKYIDDYHLYVGNCCYHICEFAEKMELSGSKVEPVNQSEPSKNKIRNREKQR